MPETFHPERFRPATRGPLILEKIVAKTVHVGVIGLGYVGLPLALNFVEVARVAVTGFDIDEARIRRLNSGRPCMAHLGEHRLKEAFDSGLFRATADLSKLTEPDALLITVPTPLTAERKPDLSFVEQTAAEIAARLRPGQLVVLESTSYPGTTRDLLKPLLETECRRCGCDFFLAYSPEREDPGNKSHPTRSVPKIVGALDTLSVDVAVALYELAFDRVIKVQSAEVAEAAKLTENVFRAVNIALVNELKVIYDRLNINIWDVLDAAATKPFGFMRFDPGPGFGGHCVPVDPFYLSWQARQHGVETRFIELAGEVNVSMPRYVISKLRVGLCERGLKLERAKVLVLGLAYKRDIDDPRESPSFELIHLLLEHGAIPVYHDPYIPEAPMMRSWPALPPMSSVPLTADGLREVEAVVIATDHRNVDYEFVAQHARFIVDTRGVFRSRYHNVVQA